MQAMLHALMTVFFTDDLQQDRQCTYKHNIEACLLNIVAMERNQNFIILFCVCVCSLSYPACHMHAPYFIVIYGLPGSAIFFHVTSKMARFKKKVI